MSRWETTSDSKVRELRDRPDHQVLRHPDAELARNELVPDEALLFVHLAPGGDERFAIERKKPSLNPVMQRFRRGSGGRGQQQRDGLGEVADGRVAVPEDPLGDSGFRDRPFDELPGLDQTLDPAADQEVDRPHGVFRRGDPEVANEGVDLLVRLRGFVESGVKLREGFHRAPGLLTLFLQPSNHRLFVAMADRNRVGAGLPDCLLETGPIGVIRKNEPTVDGLKTPLASNAHPAGCECRRNGSELLLLFLHPRRPLNGWRRDDKGIECLRFRQSNAARAINVIHLLYVFMTKCWPETRQ